jgi:hypothetical protein
MDVGGNLRVASTSVSTSTTTGALIVAGGAGISGSMFLGGNLTTNRDIDCNGNIQIDGITVSTSTTTGALVVAGGAGIVGNLNIGRDSVFNGNIQLSQLNNPFSFVSRNASTINTTLSSNASDVGIFYGTTHPAAAGLVISPRGIGSGIKMDIRGNVGIGMISPIYTLDVSGTINGRSVLVNGLPITGGGGATLYTDTINIPVFTDYTQTRQTTLIKQSISYPTTVTIQSSNVVAQLDGVLDNGQHYTFGPKIPGRWVACGKAGVGVGNYVAYSNDGINWIGLGTPSFTDNGTWGAVGWNGTTWLLFGTSAAGSSTSLRSNDGITWTTYTPTGFSGISSAGGEIAWNGNIWVMAGGGTNPLAWSFNGIQWTGVTGSTLFISAKSVAWNGSIWVAGGRSGNFTLAWSRDGNSWTGASNNPFNNSFCNGVAWNGRIWVGVGSGTNSIATSSDGISWTGRGNPFGGDGLGVAWGGNTWVAVSSGSTHTIAYSFDGITWNGLGKTIFSTSGRRVRWNGSLWVAVGQGTGNTIAYSRDGISWIGLGTSIFLGNDTGGFDVAYNSIRPHRITFPRNLIVGGLSTGDSAGLTIATSTDGITWTRTSSPGVTNGVSAIGWNGTIWVAGGNGSTNNIATSPDGFIWTGRGRNVLLSGVRDFLWAGNIWIAVGSDGASLGIAYSTNNGSNWTSASSIQFEGYRVDWNGTLIVAVGRYGSGTMYTSTNGISWTQLSGISTIFSTGSYDIIWNGSRWVAVGEGTSFTIATSLNGTTWTGVAGSTSIFTYSEGVAWNGSIFVAIGAGTNHVATSPDGITWTGRGLLTTPGNLQDVFWTGQLWIVVSSGSNRVFSSPDGVTWTVRRTISDFPYGTLGTATWTAGIGSVDISGNSFVVNNFGPSQTNTIEVVSPPYYNTGTHTNFSVSISGNV